MLDGGLGSDRLFGGDDADRLEDRGGGSDLMYGDAGDDFVFAARGANATADRLVLDGGDGDDIVSFYGDPANRVSALLTAGEGNDRVDILNGRASADAGVGDDVITVRDGHGAAVVAGDGADQLWVDSARSGTLVADMGAGDDLVTLAPYLPSRNVLTLGEGHDLVLLRASGDDRLAHDPQLSITDFSTGEGGDQLDLDAYLGAALRGWNGRDPFRTGFLRLVADGDGTLLQIDADGRRGGANCQTLITFDDNAPGAFTADNFADGYQPASAGAHPLPLVATDLLALA